MGIGTISSVSTPLLWHVYTHSIFNEDTILFPKVTHIGNIGNNSTGGWHDKLKSLDIVKNKGVGVCAKLLQLCPTFCNSVNHSPPGSSVQGILQATTLEWVAMPSSRGSSPPRYSTCISYISCIGEGGFFTTSATRHSGSKGAGTQMSEFVS